MNEEFRVIGVEDPEDLSVGEVAAAGSRLGATFALVLAGGLPLALLRIAKLDLGDTTKVGDLVRSERGLTEEPVRIELPDGEQRDITAHVEEEAAVLEGDDDTHFVVPLHGATVAAALTGAAAAVFAADTRLPGPIVPVEPHTIRYECELGHPVWQRADNANRTCWCGHELEAA